MRRLFAKLHLWLSLPLGLIISIVCLSGAALVFEKEILRALHPEFYRVRAPEGAAPLPPSELAARIHRQVPDSLRLSTLLVPADPEEAWMAGFGNVRRKLLSVNPYTGEANGWTPSSPFFQTTRKLHRWLMDAPPRKGESSVGKTVVGVATLAMAVILVSGLILWTPRSRRALKNRLSVSCTKGWRRFWYDSHVTLGFYSTLFLLVMALTGLTWSFGWYRTAAYSLFGAPPRQEKSTAAAKGRPQGKEKAAFDFGTWDSALRAAQTAYPGHASIQLGTGVLEVSTGPRKTDRLRFDRQTGRITEISRHEDVPAAQNLKGWFYAFHTGSWGGMWTKTLYFLAALIGGILPLSGYYLWYKRLHNAQNSPRRRR